MQRAICLPGLFQHQIIKFKLLTKVKSNRMSTYNNMLKWFSFNNRSHGWLKIEPFCSFFKNLSNLDVNEFSDMLMTCWSVKISDQHSCFIIFWVITWPIHVCNNLMLKHENRVRSISLHLIEMMNYHFLWTNGLVHGPMSNQFVTKPILYLNMVAPLSIWEDELALLVPTANNRILNRM